MYTQFWRTFRSIFFIGQQCYHFWTVSSPHRVCFSLVCSFCNFCILCLIVANKNDKTDKMGEAKKPKTTGKNIFAWSLLWTFWYNNGNLYVVLSPQHFYAVDQPHCGAHVNNKSQKFCPLKLKQNCQKRFWQKERKPELREAKRNKSKREKTLNCIQEHVYLR